MSESVTIRYRLTADELLTATRWNYRQRVRPAFRFLLYALCPLLLAVGLVELWRAGPSLAGFIPLWVGAYIGIMFLVLRPWLVRRQFAKRPDRDAEIQWEVGPDRLRVSYAHAQSEFSWQALFDVVQTPGGFLLYSTPQIFHWLPRHAFVGDAEFERVFQLAALHARKSRHVA